MTNKKLSVEEIKAVAEAAITARQKATNAKTALEDAGGTDEVLTEALQKAETEATVAEAAAAALSQAPNPDTSKKAEKLLRKQGIIKRELEKLGVEDDDDEDDEDDEDDIDDAAPVTHGDLKRMQARAARQTAVQMADAIGDEGQREAVRAALKRVVASNNPEEDFDAAVAIASRERNEKILEEDGRRGTVRRVATRTGAAPLVEEVFTPTAEEQMFMRAPFNLGKKEILAARGKA